MKNKSNTNLEASSDSANTIGLLSNGNITCTYAYTSSPVTRKTTTIEIYKINKKGKEKLIGREVITKERSVVNSNLPSNIGIPYTFTTTGNFDSITDTSNTLNTLNTCTGPLSDYANSK